MAFQDKAINIIKKYEGFSEKAYWDKKQWSIGYGFKARSGSDTISREEADRQMAGKVAPFAAAVEKGVTNKSLTEEQKAVLTSFAYNVGEQAFTESTLLKKINAGDLEGAKSEFMRWTNAGGKTDIGLINRREKELAMFYGKEVVDGDYVVNVKSPSPAKNTEISSTGNKIADATSLLNQLAARINNSMANEAAIQSWTDNLRREGTGA